MRGVFLIGSMIALLIVAYLTLANLKSKPMPANLNAPELNVQGTITELPKQVQSKVQEAIKRDEEQRKAAEEAMK